MAFQPAPLCSLIELIFLWNSQRVENTIWVRTDEAPNATLLANLAGATATWWINNMRTVLSQDISLVQVDATYKGVDTGPQATVTAGLPSAGAVPTESTTNGTAFVVKFGTANIGRSFRGRNYVPGIPIASYVDSVLELTTANPITSAYATLNGDLVGLGATHVVVSRKSGGVLRPVAINTPVNGYTATTRASRSQRRRNPGELR